MRAALLSCLALVACASDDNGAVPTITNLTLSQTTLPVGQQTTVSGTVAFEDPDGDLMELGVELTLPDTSKQTLPMTPLQNIGTMTSGTIAWSLIIAPPSAGTYGMELWTVDANGNASNRLDAALTAQ